MSLRGVVVTALALGGCQGPSLHVAPAPPGTPPAWLEVVGLEVPAAERTDVAGALAVHVAGQAEHLPAMLGRTEWVGDALRFTPRYPFRPGLAYQVTVRLTGRGGAPVFRCIASMPEPPPTPPTRVTAVHPSSPIVPENVLRFYLHFSAPMSQGSSYEHVQVLQSDGGPVDLPFLELGEELWNHDGTRLTLLVDPGRIKRGLKPREEIGPVFEEGRTYTLVVDRRWPDALGRPLAEGFQRELRIAAPDDQQPDPALWTVHPPTANTRGPLVVDLNEPLDHGMLQRVLEVIGPGSRPTGKVVVSAGERRWSFTPDQAWPPGRHLLQVSTDLEDCAGNSIARPFEVDLFEEITVTVAAGVTSVPFVVE